MTNRNGQESLLTGQARSMTGFGRYQAQDEQGEHGEQNWEIRAINSRYLEIKWKLPSYCRGLEREWEKIVRSHLSRGRVEITLDVRLHTPDAGCPRLDTRQALGMLEQLRILAREMNVPFEPDPHQLLLLPKLWQEPSGALPAGLTQFLSAGLRAALEDLVAARTREGAGLSRDLFTRLDRLAAIAADIGVQAEPLPVRRMEHLQQRVAALLHAHNMDTAAPCLAIEDARLLQELALLSDRLDVSEELTRLDAHLQEARRVLRDLADPGRRLDFLFQECLREITTCGNKCQNAAISRAVVDFKAQLEKCREQVQNLE